MGLTERVTRNIDLKAWHGEFPVEFLYTAGIAGERFFRELKDSGRIMGTRCEKCDAVYVPPKIYCERCFEGLEEWVDAGLTGIVHTFTVAHIDVDGKRLKKPVVIGLIKFGNSTGGLVHIISGIKPADVAIGMPVRAALKPKKSREGSIHDIQNFVPISHA